VKLRRQKALKLAVRSLIGKAYAAEEKGLLYDEAKKRRSKAIYPALVLTLNCGLRDKKLRELQWGRIHLADAYLVVGESKTDAGSGRTIPLNSLALEVMKTYSAWYLEKFEYSSPTGLSPLPESLNPPIQRSHAAASRRSGGRFAWPPASKVFGMITATRSALGWPNRARRATRRSWTLPATSPNGCSSIIRTSAWRPNDAR
jgi:integrase